MGQGCTTCPRDKAATVRFKSRREAYETECYMTGDCYEEGMAVRREVLGDSYVDQAAANAAFRVVQRVLDDVEQQHDSH
jgi:hypothetical protein